MQLPWHKSWTSPSCSYRSQGWNWSSHYPHFFSYQVQQIMVACSLITSEITSKSSVMNSKMKAHSWRSIPTTMAVRPASSSTMEQIHTFSQLRLGNTSSWKNSYRKQLLLSSFKPPFWLAVVCEDVTEHRKCWLGSFVPTRGKKLSKKWTVPVPAQPQRESQHWNGKVLLFHGQEIIPTKAGINPGQWLEQMK